MRLALATCARYSDLPADERILQDAFLARGVEATPAVWDDPDVAWSEFDAVIIRSTWDYHLAAERFSQWVENVSAQTILINNSRLVQWNLHKRYLRELETKGVAIVSTTLLLRGEHRDFDRVMEELGASEVVVKPAVSASGHRTVVIGGEYAALADGERILRESVADHDTLVQPFLREIFDPGERSLMFFAGRFSHAVVRPPLSAGAAAGKSPGRLLDPPPEQTKFALNVLAHLERVPVYARVDIVPLRSGTIALAELELVEPSLYFAQQPASAERFVDAVLDGFASSRRS